MPGVIRKLGTWFKTQFLNLWKLISQEETPPHLTAYQVGNGYQFEPKHFKEFTTLQYVATCTQSGQTQLLTAWESEEARNSKQTLFETQALSGPPAAAAPPTVFAPDPPRRSFSKKMVMLGTGLLLVLGKVIGTAVLGAFEGSDLVLVKAMDRETIDIVEKDTMGKVATVRVRSRTTASSVVVKKQLMTPGGKTPVREEKEELDLTSGEERELSFNLDGGLAAGQYEVHFHVTGRSGLLGGEEKDSRCIKVTVWPTKKLEYHGLSPDPRKKDVTRLTLKFRCGRSGSYQFSCALFGLMGVKVLSVQDGWDETIKNIDDPLNLNSNGGSASIWWETTNIPALAEREYLVLLGGVVDRSDLDKRIREQVEESVLLLRAEGVQR